MSLLHGTPDCGSYGHPHLCVSNQARGAGHTSRQQVTWVLYIPCGPLTITLALQDLRYPPPAYSQGARGAGPLPTMPMSPQTQGPTSNTLT